VTQPPTKPPAAKAVPMPEMALHMAQKVTILVEAAELMWVMGVM
jgi:hypothetical protein